MRRYSIPIFLLLFSVAMAVLSPGFFEADEISHYLKGREIFEDWRGVLDIWGRPACTGLYGLASLCGGLIAARILAVVVTGLTATGTVRLWEGLGLSQEKTLGTSAGSALWLLLYAQPLFLMNSFAVMTEMLLACSWVWAAVLLVKRRPVLAGFVLGLGGLARPEGWFALAAWPVFLAYWSGRGGEKLSHGRWLLAVLASAVAMAAWYGAGVMAFENWRWPRDQFPWSAASQYGKTGLFFVGSAVVSLGVWMWGPVVRAVWGQWRAGGWQRSPVVLVVTVPFVGFYLLHGVLGTFGLMGSMSLPRYFVGVAPFAAILALTGLQRWEQSAFILRRTLRRRKMQRVVLVMIALPAAVLIAFGQLPTSKTTDMKRLDVAMAAYREKVPEAERSQKLIAGHPYVFYALGLSMNTPAHTRVFDRRAIAFAQPGTYLITDSKIWVYEGRPTAEELRGMGYEEDAASAAEIDAVPTKIDLTTLGFQFNAVRLWRKMVP